MAYDASRQKIVLFGGYGSTLFGDTWEYDGTTWTQRFPTTSPAPRRYAAMTYDPIRHVTLLFGGDSGIAGNAPQLSDWWKWDGTTWTALSSGPSARSWAGLTWDSARSRAVLFGGATSGVPLSDTWEWTEVGWTQAGAGNPPARQIFSIAFDAQRSRTVFYGGYNAGAAGGTWEYASSWLQANPSGAPPGQFAAPLVFDSVAQRVVLIGGSNGSALATVWTYDGSTWEAWPSLPTARGYASAAYDAARGKIVVFGGFTTTALSETLEY
jgi:Galactose oxidase, central domain